MKFTSDIKVEVIQIMGGDLEICQAAMVSTRGALREPVSEEKQKGLINFLMKRRHGTPFEQAAITFCVHAPIFVWREWHRHRIGMSYNEESARYKSLDPVFWIPRPERKMFPVADPGNQCIEKIVRLAGGGFVCNGSLLKLENGLKQCQSCTKIYQYHASSRPCFGPADKEQYDWFVTDQQDTCRIAYRAYEERIKRGYALEVARTCLPVSIYSSCWVTCNPRSLMHFLSLRVYDPEAMFVSRPQAEIQEAALACEQVLREGWPYTYEAFVKNKRVGP